MLDGLVERLLDEERERERFVKQASLVKPQPKRPRKVHWIDTLLDDINDDDSDEELPGFQKANEPCDAVKPNSTSLDSGDEIDLQLRRCASHRPPPVQPVLGQNSILKLANPRIKAAA
jgi:hypothetical protein